MSATYSSDTYDSDTYDTGEEQEITTGWQNRPSVPFVYIKPIEPQEQRQLTLEDTPMLTVVNLAVIARVKNFTLTLPVTILKNSFLRVIHAIQVRDNTPVKPSELAIFSVECEIAVIDSPQEIAEIAEVAEIARVYFELVKSGKLDDHV